jgi:hypothetical protein
MNPDKPNHVHMCGERTFGAPFGAVYSVTPIAIPGLGHDPHLHIAFRFGLSMDITPADAAELSRRIPEALARLPFLPPIHDAVVRQGDE